MSRDEQEIIEFPFVVYSVREKKVVFKKQTYIRPEFTPITSFCKKLTGDLLSGKFIDILFEYMSVGITETVVSGGSTLQATVDDFVHYVESNFVKTGKTFNLVTHGHWDLVVVIFRAKYIPVFSSCINIGPITFRMQQKRDPNSSLDATLL